MIRLRTDGVAVLFRPEDLLLLLGVVAGKVWRLWLNVLLLTGVIVAWRNHRQPLALLSVFGWAGILLSVPFAPPWDADNMRAYAATLPFVVALPSIGVLYDFPGPLSVHPGAARRTCSGIRDVLGFGALLLVLLIPVPLTLAMLSDSVRWTSGGGSVWRPGCEGPREARALHLNPRSAVHVRESAGGPAVDRLGNYVSLPGVLARDHANEYLDVLYMWRGLSRMEGGATLFSAYDLDRGTTLYVQASSAAFPRMRPYVAVCGETVRYARIEWFRADAFAACPSIGRCGMGDQTAPNAERTPR